jgi:propionyl-CoA carboxylase alpha chain
VWLDDVEVKLDIRRAQPDALEDKDPQASGTTLEVSFIEAQGNARSSILVSSWKAGDALWSGAVDGERISVQVRPVLNGFDLSHHGVQVRAYVYTEREGQAARLMPARKSADAGKAVRCPMPGLVMSIHVVEGQEVKAGETLAIIEAMKMENVLRAERDGVVKKIRAKKGDSLAVDAVILEFA